MACGRGRGKRLVAWLASVARRRRWKSGRWRLLGFQVGGLLVQPDETGGIDTGGFHPDPYAPEGAPGKSSGK